MWEPPQEPPVAPTLKLEGAVLHIALDRDGRRLATATAAGLAARGRSGTPPPARRSRRLSSTPEASVTST